MAKKQNEINIYTEVIGLVPAGGQATRIAPLPCNKELIPRWLSHMGNSLQEAHRYG